jgi:hypothetical protein
MENQNSSKNRLGYPGIRRETANGERYLFPSVWVDPYTQFKIKELSNVYDISETHLAGIIIDQFIQSGAELDLTRVDFYKQVTARKIFESMKKARED